MRVEQPDGTKNFEPVRNKLKDPRKKRLKPPPHDPTPQIPEPTEIIEKKERSDEAASSLLAKLLPPPPALISETISRYKDSTVFKDAFFEEEKVETNNDALLHREEEIAPQQDLTENLEPHTAFEEESLFHFAEEEGQPPFTEEAPKDPSQ